MHLAECREFLENSLAHDRRTQVAKLATFTAILVAKNVFLLAIATKMVTAWSTCYKVLYVLFSFCFNFESSNWLCSQGKPSPWPLGKALPSFPLYYSNYALCLDCECLFINLQVGDPVLLVFNNGARGFLSFPKPLFGSECNDNNPAGVYRVIPFVVNAISHY